MTAITNDKLVLEDGLDVGHLVIITNRASGARTLRRLQPSEADTYLGDVLRIEAGEGPGERRLRVVRPAGR